MNGKIAISRMDDIMRPDAVTLSDEDFLVTHVPLRKISELSTFEYNPNPSKFISEQDILDTYVKNPKNKHQFIVVYGESGTGKSHLIRWLKTSYDAIKPDSEVVLFIRRNDNTLKGTILQLLKIDEVRNLLTEEQYERLSEASSIEDEAKLKSLLLSNLRNEIEYENTEAPDYGELLSRREVKRLLAFLKNDAVEKKLLEDNGPIDRIYTKINPRSTMKKSDSIGRDTTAEFRSSDFSFLDQINTIGYQDDEASGEEWDITSWDRKAAKFVRDYENEDNELRENLPVYLNRFVEGLIQRSTGVRGEDFQQLFLEIRRALKKQKKNLTLFIEDITSFTGVNGALLNALMEEHTGANRQKGQESELCRISSFVGTTNAYFQNGVKDNFRDRVSQYLYISKDAFNESQRYEFFAKYLNAASLTADKVHNWAVSRHETGVKLPVASETQDEDWEHVRIDDNISLSLYPFTKHSIDYLYSNYLVDKTPRYILRNIMEPNLRRILTNPTEFPAYEGTTEMNNDARQLRMQLEHQIEDKNIVKRMEKLLAVWGNGKAEESTVNGTRYISGLNSSFLKEIGLPDVTFNKIAASEPVHTVVVPEEVTTVEAEEIVPSTTVVSPFEEKRNNLSNRLWADWLTSNELIRLQGSKKEVQTIKDQLDRLNGLLFSLIDWMNEGFTCGEILQLKTRNYLVKLQNQKGKGDNALYALPKTMESVNLLLNVFDFTQKNQDPTVKRNAMFEITRWVTRHKEEIVSCYRSHVQKEAQKQTAEILRALLVAKMMTGEIHSSTGLKNYKLMDLLQSDRNTEIPVGHSQDWNKLIEKLDMAQNLQKLELYYDLPQGRSYTSNARGKIVLDYKALDQSYKSIHKGFLKDTDLSSYAAVAAKEMQRSQAAADQISNYLDRTQPEEYKYLLRVFNKLVDTVKDSKLNTRVRDITLPKADKFSQMLRVYEKTPDLSMEQFEAMPPEEQLFAAASTNLEGLNTLLEILKDMDRYINQIQGTGVLNDVDKLQEEDKNQSNLSDLEEPLIEAGNLLEEIRYAAR